MTVAGGRRARPPAALSGSTRGDMSQKVHSLNHNVVIGVSGVFRLDRMKLSTRNVAGPYAGFSEGGFEMERKVGA